MKQWLTTGGIVIVCIGVWTALFLSIFDQGSTIKNAANEDMTEIDNKDTSILEEPEEAMDEAADLESEWIMDDVALVREPEGDMAEARHLYDVAESISVRGIWPGDFDDIAPDKLISVDILLKEIEDIK
ncbi:hypothetical protein SAMN05421736_10914 [Evansella caseinilytica]|uniref:Uncharacterized protein n=1 Tax=Evansella caseinilytica TaxID=1503961 RepID=A0A1H3RSV1_9BACI|nr:hypothetical protein [Evansella caseinilytica]SDZ28348.1 hypothetical protein SAMN05421736_10914 [Evansella caseinilytica]